MHLGPPYRLRRCQITSSGVSHIQSPDPDGDRVASLTSLPRGLGGHVVQLRCVDSVALTIGRDAHSFSGHEEAAARSARGPRSARGLDGQKPDVQREEEEQGGGGKLAKYSGVRRSGFVTALG